MQEIGEDQPADSHYGITKVAELTRYLSRKPYEQISLKEFVDRKGEGLNNIFYIGGESIAAVSSPPFPSVRYTMDPIDEYAVQGVDASVGASSSQADPRFRRTRSQCEARTRLPTPSWSATARGSEGPRPSE